jgi:hypothetical protein
MVGCLFALWGAWIGARALNDNSFLTHLATGRLILADGIPGDDPYSFTATGAAWSVQSWLVSVVFAVAERLGGDATVHLSIMALTTVLAGLVWTITRPAGGLVSRVALSGLAIGVGAATWAERPLLVGLIGLCLVVLAAEDRLDPRWLLPVMWVWVNSHGSFPLGLAALACFYVGARLDGEGAEVERRALLWCGAGIVAGAVGPLGPAILAFPLQLLSQSEALSNIVEWASPSFADPWARLFFVQIAVAILVLVRRPSYRSAVPLVVFTGAALLAARNVPVAAIVYLPGMGLGLRGLGSLTGEERSIVTAVGTAAVAVAGLALVVGTATGPTYALDMYPTGPVAWMEANELGTTDNRVAVQDFVGNYLEAVKGDEANVFIDDRYDMYPVELSDDYLALLQGSPEWRAVLDRHEIDAVLWERDEALSELLVASPEWQVVYDDQSWLVATRR